MTKDDQFQILTDQNGTVPLTDAAKFRNRHSSFANAIAENQDGRAG
jgi:hypothetical protein